MGDFKGVTVQLTLKHPPGMVVHGVVQEVLAGQTLTLVNVFFPGTGQQIDRWTVQSAVIADLQVMEKAAMNHVPPREQAAAVLPNPVSIQSHNLHKTSQTASNGFVDPAILSFNKSAMPPTGVAQRMPAVGTPIDLSHDLFVNPKNGQLSTKDSMQTTSQRIETEEEGVARIQAPALAPTLSKQNGDAEDGFVQETVSGKRKQRRGQKKKAAGPDQDFPRVMNSEVSRNGNDMAGGVKRGKGWRQGPFLQPSHPSTPPGGVKSIHRKTRGDDRDAASGGWATENATDIQGLDDFDFVASNKLFDKQQVFQELRQGDTTADEDRLVSHNKIARPGTHGGKNIHPTENVLSPKLGPKYNSNGADSASDADTELNLTNGRSSSRHSHTHTAQAKKQASRQNSILYDVKPQTGITAPTMERVASRSVTSLATRGRKSLPDTDRLPSPLSVGPGLKQRSHPAEAPSQSCFFIHGTNSICPVLHPSGLQTLENETTSRFGLTPDAMTEVAARSMAEKAMSMCRHRGISRQNSRDVALGPKSDDSWEAPVVVILAGGHTTGARAIAAARHLASRKYKIIVAEHFLESTSDHETQARAQTSMLRRLQRSGADIRRGSWEKASQYIKNLSGPPALIVDALLGGQSFAALTQLGSNRDMQGAQTIKEMIDWANRSRAPVLSIGCPSGVSGIDGSSTIIEGEPLAVRPDSILCLGVPVLGLREAMNTGEKWSLSVADISVNITLRAEEAVAFGTRFVVDLDWRSKSEPLF